MSNPQYDYWYNRERENLERYQLNEEEWERELQRIYSEMFDDVQLQINNFWSRYSTQEGININVAKQRVNEFDVEAYSRNVAQIIRTQPLSPQALSELRLYNATMRVNRLEMLKSTIGAELLPHFDNVDRLFNDKLTTRVTQEMRRQAGLLGRTIASNAMDARSIVGASFRNATFSQRIWGQNHRLRNELSNILNSALIQGRHPREFAGRLRDMFGHDAINDSLRLLQTEMARVQTEAQKLSFERGGFTQYVFLAIDDDATCEACMSLDGKVFNVADMQVGSNAGPLHPFCRCSAAARGGNQQNNFTDAPENGTMNALDSARNINDLEDFARREWGVNSIDLQGLDFEAVKGTFVAMDEMFRKYPQLKGSVREIGQGKHGLMSTDSPFNGFRIEFNPFEYSDINRIASKYDRLVQEGHFPQGTTYQNGGVHELAHVMHGIVSVKKSDGMIAATADFNSHATTKRIVNQAWRNVKKEYPKGTRNVDAYRLISGYANETRSETVAEAFSDVFSNGENAQPLSIEIVNIVERELN